MAVRYFNWKLAIVLVVAAVVFVVAVISLHHWQKSTRAQQGLSRGLKAFDSQKWDEAAEQLGHYVGMNNQDTAVLAKYAEAQVNRRPVNSGNVNLAVAAYRNILRFKPNDVDATRRLAELYLSMRAPAEAESTAQRYLERQDDARLRRMLGEALWKQRKFDQALAEMKKVVETHPDEIRAYDFLGRAAEERPDAEGKQAAEWFDEAVSKNPDVALAYAVRAGHHLRSNNKEQAVADLTRALGCDLSDADVRLAVVEGLMAAGVWDKAREQLETLEAADPTNRGLWHAWANLVVRTRSEEEKQAVAERGMKALEMYPWDFIPVATRLLILSGRLEKVEEYLSWMRGKDFDPITVASLEGTLKEQQGRAREAIEAWQRVVSFPPGTERESDIQMQTYLQLASAFSELNDEQSAINQLQILLSKQPSFANLIQGRLALARLYAQTRDWDKVQEQTRQIQRVARGYPDVMQEAALLELQAQSSLLAAGGTTGTEPQGWNDIDTRLTELSKGRDDVLNVRLLQIQIAMARKEFAKATSLLDELEGKYSSDVRLMVLRADLCAAQGQNAEAKALYEEAVAKFPQAYGPVRGLALFLNRQDQRPECELAVKEAFVRIQEPQVRRELGHLLAEFYYRWQEQEKLCRWLTDLATQFPSDIQTKRLLLICEQVVQDEGRFQKIVDEIKVLEGEKGSQWRYEQARLWLTHKDEFRKAAGPNPDPAKPLRDTNIYAQTVKLLQENLLNNAEDQPSRLLLARVYELARERQLALTLYREALARDPNNVQIVVPAVSALQSGGEFEEAQVILDRMGGQDLNHPTLQKLLVGSDVQRGDLTSASATLQRLIEQDANDVGLKLTYARVLILRQQFAEAEAILKELRAKQPDSIPVAYVQIRLHTLQGDVTKAMQLCDEMIKLLHNAAAYMLRAETNLSQKEYDKALQDLGQAITLEPENVGTWEARARVYSSMGRLDDAISDVRRALTVASDEPRDRKAQVQKLATSLFIASGKQALWREAEEMLDKALAGQTGQQGKVDPELRLYKARVLTLRGTGPATEEARRLLQQVVADYPKYVDGWKMMAQLELDQEEPGRALDYATRGLAHNEQNKDLLILKAMAEKRLSPSVAALTTLPMLAAQYPGDVGILIEWADAHARAGRPEKAVELLESKLANFSGMGRRRCEIALAAAMYSDQRREEAKTLFEKLIAAEPNDPTPVMTLGQLLRRERRWTEVNQLVNLWRTTNPKDAETATSMARILAGSGDRQALQLAEDQLRMILDPNPESLSTLVLLGMLMQDAGRNDEAARLNRQILALDPNNVIAINNLAWMLCEQPTSSPEAVNEAIELADRGLKLIPDYIDLLDTRGVAHYRAGNMEKAEADLAKCVSLFPLNSPQSAAPQFHLAQAYAAMSRRTQAVEHLKIALNLNGLNIQLAKDHAEVGRRTHAIKVLRDAISLQDQMDQFKTGFDQQDLIGVRPGTDWTQARLDLEQLQKGR